MGAADKQDGVVTALAHTADIGNAHGKKTEGFDPGGVFGDAPGIKNALKFQFIATQRLKAIS